MVNPIPPAPRTVQSMLEEWLLAHGFPLQERIQQGGGFTDGYRVEASRAAFDTALVRYCGSERLEDALMEVAEAVAQAGVASDWRYEGRQRVLTLLVFGGRATTSSEGSLRRWAEPSSP